MAANMATVLVLLKVFLIRERQGVESSTGNQSVEYEGYADSGFWGVT